MSLSIMRGAIRSVDEQMKRIASMEEQLQPTNWQEGLVSSALHPKYSESVHLLSRVCLALLAAVVTVATCGIGFFLVRSVHTHYTSYQERVNALIKQIVKEKLYPAVTPKPEITRCRQAKTPFELQSYIEPKSAVVQYAKKKMKKGADPVFVPEELVRKWREELQGLSFDSMPYLRKLDELWKNIITLPWTAQLEDREKTALNNIFFASKVKERLQEVRSIKYSQIILCDRNLQDSLEFLQESYRIGLLAQEVYAMLSDRIDLSSVDSFFWMEKGEIVIPTIYGTALIAAYYEIKYGVCIQMGTATTLKKLLQERSSQSAYGFILFSESQTLQPHVTPMIVISARREILYLDSVGNTPLPSLFMDIKDFTLYSLAVARQADYHSCRADALSILSNALWQIQQMGIQSIEEIPEIKRNTLPAAWAKTVQRSVALEGVDTSASIRTKSEQTLAEFIDAHSEESGEKKIRRYLLQKGYKYGAQIVELVSNKEAYPEIWACFHKKLKLFENDGFSLQRQP